MSKAILVMDMPDSCDECSLFCNYYSDMCCGGLHNRTIDYPYPENFRQEWCPLQTPPLEEEYSDCFDEFEDGYAQGWNDCIEEIFG